MLNVPKIPPPVIIFLIELNVPVTKRRTYLFFLNLPYRESQREIEPERLMPNTVVLSFVVFRFRLALHGIFYDVIVHVELQRRSPRGPLSIPFVREIKADSGERFREGYAVRGPRNLPNGGFNAR